MLQSPWVRSPARVAAASNVSGRPANTSAGYCTRVNPAATLTTCNDPAAGGKHASLDAPRAGEYLQPVAAEQTIAGETRLAGGKSELQQGRVPGNAR